MSAMVQVRAELNGVTLYVEAGQFEAVAAFYESVVSSETLFARAGHIRCVAVGPERSLCVHEAEADRHAGEVEVIFWVDDLEAFAAHAVECGLEPERRADALVTRDPLGRWLRFQERPPPSRDGGELSG